MKTLPISRLGNTTIITQSYTDPPTVTNSEQVLYSAYSEGYSSIDGDKRHESRHSYDYFEVFGPTGSSTSTTRLSSDSSLISRLDISGVMPLGAGSSDHLSDSGRVMNEAYGKVFKRLSEHDSDLTTTTGEFSTASHARPSRRSVTSDYATSVRNAKVVKSLPPLSAAVKLTETISNSHLAWKFYYKPLVDSMWKAIDFKLRDIPQRQRVRATTHVDSSVSFSSYPKSEIQTSTSHMVEIRYTRLPGTPVQQLLDAFGTMNPALLAWNLMPYSFIVDWFYDVSGYLDALGYVGDSRITDIWLSYLRVTRSKRVYADSYGRINGPYHEDGSISASGSTKRSTFYRVPISSVPMPYPPTLSIPSSDLGSKALTTAELILQSFLK